MPRYQIVDAKGPDYYNDTEIYTTRVEAEIELARARKWAKRESKSEPTWGHAQLQIVELMEGVNE
jgi:hypothetical protein